MTSPSDNEKQPYNGFRAAREEIIARLKMPLGHTTFWLNMMIGVVGLGGVAIWIEAWHWWQSELSDPPLENLKLALATVFPAVMGGSAYELCLSKKVITRNIGWTALAVCFLSALYLLGFGHPSDQVAIRMGIICCLFSVVVWWIAKGRDETMRDEDADPDDAVGGLATRPLTSRPTKLKT
ncbi:hypothetical protein ELG88_18075 [Rhizobium leguminosarum]|uniref:hypothetical protein n=1 Tax=Rhizobium leguminosarum TaxID=384 RepID=UPI0010311123|nr:hypothetical protein [Rhizobium leguminosarum]TBF36991.1 hypothetical protein ELG88_18075 [Rhizobium leguminosarum]